MLFEGPSNKSLKFYLQNYSLNYWIEKGAPSRKIVMGMPLYGQSFTLENTRNNGLNAKAPGPGKAGEFTRAAGFLAYYEVILMKELKTSGIRYESVSLIYPIFEIDM